MVLIWALETPFALTGEGEGWEGCGWRLAVNPCEEEE